MLQPVDSPRSLKELPSCLFFLVALALASHTCVLLGNLSTAQFITHLGESSEGWGNVGGSLAKALQTELDPAMANVTNLLTQTLGLVSEIEGGVDLLLSVTGTAADTALAGFHPGEQNSQEFQANTSADLRHVAEKNVAQVRRLVEQLLLLLRPAFAQFRHWLLSFSDQVRRPLDEFGSTLDRAQKLFDEAMLARKGGTRNNEEAMVRETYDLFDVDKSGTVMPDDLRGVARLYGITALTGQKGPTLFSKYDADHLGGLTLEEFHLFVQDPSLNGILDVILRTFAQKLAMVAGHAASAQSRDEAARALCDYLTLYCAKNHTKVGWISDALSNGSLPLGFTADVLAELAASVDDPNRLALFDVGQVVLRKMLDLNASQSIEAVKLVSTPEFWDSEGFTINQQPEIVERIVGWLANSSVGLQWLQGGALGIAPLPGEGFPAASKRRVQEKLIAYNVGMRRSMANDIKAMYKSPGAQALRAALLGGVEAIVLASSRDALATFGKGKMAKPQTLEFMHWLAANATRLSLEHLQECFIYSAASSMATDSIASSISAMMRRTLGVVKVMQGYAGPDGVARLEAEAWRFINQSVDDLMLVSTRYVSGGVDAARCQAGETVLCKQVKQEALDLPLELSGSFVFLDGFLIEMKGVLPSVIKDLKDARRKVASFAKGLDSSMTVLRHSAPPLLQSIAKIYKKLWLGYYLTFSVLTTVILLYGLWAAGWFGPPQVSDDGHRVPRGLGGRFGVVFRSCCVWMGGYADSHLCFWSGLLLLEALVLLAFVLAVAVNIVGAVELFVSKSCSQIYVLGDSNLCTGSLQTVQKVLKTFWSASTVQSEVVGAVDTACLDQRLLTCRLITEHFTGTFCASCLGAVIAAVVSFQLIIESAVLHERVLWKHLQKEAG